MSTPPTKYVKSGDASIAYQVVGDGPIDLVVVLGFATHLELQWESPPFAGFFERLGSFSRLIIFDKRGTGLSDPVTEVPTLEQRVDDVRAVMNAAGSERAALFGVSEGGPMSVLFAATHPDRVSALVLPAQWGGPPRRPITPGPRRRRRFASPPPSSSPRTGANTQRGWSNSSLPASATIPRPRSSPPGWSAPLRVRRWSSRSSRCFWTSMCEPSSPRSRFRRSSYTGAATVVNRRAGEELAGQIPHARYVELPGIDHLPWAGDSEAVLGEIEEFLTGARSVAEPDRVLATVMFTDIVGSTERAAELGDTRWRELLAAHQEAVRRELIRFRGREVKTLGDGGLATFDGPARAIQCGGAITEAARSLGLEVRVGLHCGEIELMVEDVGGIAVHIAARVGALADAGEVLVSSTVKDLVAGSGIRFDDRGEKHLKGVSGRLAAVHSSPVAPARRVDADLRSLINGYACKRAVSPERTPSDASPIPPRRHRLPPPRPHGPGLDRGGDRDHRGRLLAGRGVRGRLRHAGIGVEGGERSHRGAVRADTRVRRSTSSGRTRPAPPAPPPGSASTRSSPRPSRSRTSRSTPRSGSRRTARSDRRRCR